MGKHGKTCSLVPMLVGCHTAKALSRTLEKTEEYLLAPALLTSPSLFSRFSQAPLTSSLSVTGLGRMDRRSPQPCLFAPCLFPYMWAHNLTRLTFIVQGMLLQLLVPTASGLGRESSKAWLWFGWSSVYFSAKTWITPGTWPWVTLLIIFV